MKFHPPVKIFTIFVALAISLSAVTPIEAASPGVRTSHFLHRLKTLPAGTAAYTRVEKLVDALVDLSPLQSYKYFRIGVSRISSGSRKTYPAIKLQKFTIKAVRKSNLTETQKRSIYVKIAKFFPLTY